MSETNVNNLPGIQWWMKRRANYFFRRGIIFLIIVCLMVFLFLTAKDDITSLKEIVPLVLLFLFFLYFTGHQFVMWYRSLHWDITNYWFGKIVEMHYIRNKKRKIKSYRIIADVNGKTMEGICLQRTYNRAKIGDSVLLFTLNSDKVFCVHPTE